MNTLKFALVHKPNQVEYTPEVIDHIRKHIRDYPGYKAVTTNGRVGLFYDGKPIMPSNKIDAFLEKLYNDPSIGFTGRDKLYGKVKNRYYGVSKRRVEKFVAEKKTGQKHEKQIIRQPTAPAQLWQLRTVNVEDKAVVVVRDEYSKFIMALPLNETKTDLPEKFESILSTPLRFRWATDNNEAEQRADRLIPMLAKQLVGLERLNAEGKLEPKMIPVLEKYRDVISQDDPSVSDIRAAMTMYDEGGKTPESEQQRQQQQQQRFEEYVVKKPETWKVDGLSTTVLPVPPMLLVVGKEASSPRLVSALDKYGIRHAPLTAQTGDEFIDTLEDAISRYPLDISVTVALKRIVHEYNSTTNPEIRQKPVERHVGLTEEHEKQESESEEESEDEGTDTAEVDNKGERRETRKVVIPHSELQRRIIAGRHKRK